MDIVSIPYRRNESAILNLMGLNDTLVSIPYRRNERPLYQVTRARDYPFQFLIGAMKGGI